ncbi:MAG: hypothetical protein HPY66_0504 [Firmicutes bacterium]|nr:hypothetical protein [Bacillota bacterium]MDI6704939.1 DUF2225 domain-containing protein [Bacillota bacterium]
MDNALYQVKMNCPVCGVEFRTTRVKTSRSIVESRDADFCLHYKFENPMLYEAVVCPMCGYSSIYNSFSSIDEKDVNRIFEGIGRKWKQRDLGGRRTLDDALDAYKLVLICSQLRRDKRPGTFAQICLRLAWINRYKEDRAEEKRFLQYALEHYREAYQHERLMDKSDEIAVIYLIGELNRRLGHYNDAIKWFSQVVSHEARHNKPIIEKMAREQWSAARQQAEEDRKNG